MMSFIKKYKIHILSTLIVIFFIGSCNKGRKISRIEAELASMTETLNNEKFRSDSIIQSIKNQYYNNFEELDTWISNRDRGTQLMELHPIIKRMKSNGHYKK